MKKQISRTFLTRDGEAGDVAPISPPPPKTQEQRFYFARKAICKKCGSDDTYARSTQGPIQYRKCRKCWNTWALKGEPLPVAPPTTAKPVTGAAT